MKRPLFWGTVAFLGTTAAFLCLQSPFFAAGAAVLAVLLVWLASRGGVRALFGFSLCALAAVISLFLHLFLTDAQLSPFYGQEVHGAMTVEEATVSGSGHFMEGVARLQAPDGTRIVRRIRLAEWGRETAQPGDSLSFSAVCEERPEGFSALSDDLFLRLSREEDGLSAPRFFSLLARLRRMAADAAQNSLPGEAGAVLTALLTGLRSQLGSDLNAAFRAAGMSHLLVVSGLHLSLAAGTVQRLPFLRKRCRLAAKLSALSVWGMALFTGLGLSAVRAAVLVTMTLFSTLFSRRGDSLTSLAFAGLCIAMVSPAAVVSASFLLSFSSVMGLMCLSPVLERFLMPEEKHFPAVLRRLLPALSSGLAAQIGTLPVLAGLFGVFSVSGIFANLIAIPLLLPILLTGAAALVLQPLRMILAPLCGLLIRLMCAVARLAAAAPLARLGVSETWQVVWLLGTYLILISALIRKPKKETGRRIFSVLLLAFSLGCLGDTVGARQTVTMTVPEGGGTVLLSRGTAAVVFGVPADTDDAEALCDLLHRQNIVTLECVFSSESVLKSATAVLLSEFDTAAVIAPDTAANREICRNLGVPLCSLGEDARLLGALPVASTTEELTVPKDGFLCPMENFYVIIGEKARVLPLLPDTALRIRFFLGGSYDL